VTNCKKIWEDEVVACRIITSLFARWSKETQKNLRQGSVCPFWELKRVPPEYKFRISAL